MVGAFCHEMQPMRKECCRGGVVFFLGVCSPSKHYISVSVLQEYAKDDK